MSTLLQNSTYHSRRENLQSSIGFTSKSELFHKQFTEFYINTASSHSKKFYLTSSSPCYPSKSLHQRFPSMKHLKKNSLKVSVQEGIAQNLCTFSDSSSCSLRSNSIHFYLSCCFNSHHILADILNFYSCSNWGKCTDLGQSVES